MPWSAERAFAVRGALPERFRAAVDLGGGCGLRQGEIFGLPVDEIDFDSGWLHVVNQVKVTKQGLVFAPPKRNKLRDVRVPDRVAHALKLHMDAFPPVEVTLPWLRPDGPLVTRRLLFTRLDGAGAIRRTDFNHRAWKPALVAAGVIPAPKRGERYQAAREHGMHTLRVYTHLMPSGDARARKAVDSLLYEGTDPAPDGPETAQGSETRWGHRSTTVGPIRRISGKPALTCA